ncbi:MAG: hypothetical protein EXQ87_13550 [Alphaproteobacteria bacterium]|nr:hypothetical protein [Alphaproteobacteria bacterium]
MATLGWLAVSSPEGTAAVLDAFRAGLATQGWIEGRNYRMEPRYAHGVRERLPALADELVAAKVDVLVTLGPAALSARGAARQLPVVFGFSGDPVVAKLTESFARPSANMTGMSFMTVELNGKRLDILRDFLPQLDNVVVMGSPQHAGVDAEREDSAKTLKALGIRLRYLPISNAGDFEEAAAALVADPPQAILLFPDGITIQLREPIIAFGLKHGIPTVSGWALYAESGALFTYGPRLTDAYRPVASYVDRILKGAKPADLPIEQPTTFELVVNLKTAKALGITVPESIFMRADEIIQ